MKSQTLSIPLAGDIKVAAIWTWPKTPQAIVVLAHGAGAGMHHAFMADIAADLAARELAILRFQFPYMETGRKLPDREPVLTQTVVAALQVGLAQANGLPVFAAGRSMGGRMSALALSKDTADLVRSQVAGLVYLGFPLHPAGKPSTARAVALDGLVLPQLFIQGTRDALADFGLMQALLASLGDQAQLHVIADGDHSFKVRRSSGSTSAKAYAHLVEVVAAFCLGGFASRRKDL